MGLQTHETISLKDAAFRPGPFSLTSPFADNIRRLEHNWS